jgi:L-fuconolactonase
VGAARPVGERHSVCFGRRAGALLQGAYLAAELSEDLADGGHLVRGTVFVECHAFLDKAAPAHLRSVGETRAVAALAAAGAQPRALPLLGMLVSADLTLAPDLLREALDRHAEAGAGLLRGVRSQQSWDPDSLINSSAPRSDHVCGEAFVRGARELLRRGLVLDLWLYHHQLRHVLSLAQQLPELSIVVDHLGGPLGIRAYGGASATSAVYEQWRRDTEALAQQCPNVRIKLGGVLMRQVGLGFDERPAPAGSREIADKIAPWIRHCLRVFGPSRCMFESNFPMDKVSASYGVLWNAFKRVAVEHGCSAAELQRLFAGTAVETYRLDVPEHLLRWPEAGGQCASL